MKKYSLYFLAACCVMNVSAITYADGNAEETAEMEEYKTIGEEKEDCFEVKLINHTGKEIIGVAIKEIEEEEFSENLLTDDDVFEIDETRVLYYAPEKEAEEKEAEENSEEEKLLTDGYDIELSFSDEEKAVLHSFPFEEMEEGEILLEDDIAYVKYISIETEEEISTLEAERMIAGVAEEYDPSQEVVVYDEGYEEYYYEEPSYDYYEEPVYGYEEPDYGDYGSYEEPVYTEPAGGGDDACLGDGLFY